MLSCIFATCLSVLRLAILVAASVVSSDKCIVGANHVLLLRDEKILALTIATGKSEVYLLKGRLTKIISVDEEGLFVFFCDEKTPVLIDFRTRQERTFDIFEQNNHRCDFALDDSENIYVLSSVEFGTFDNLQSGKLGKMFPKNLAVFSKAKLIESEITESSDGPAPERNVSTETISGVPIGGKTIGLGKIRIGFLGLDLDSVKDTLTLVEFDGTELSVVTDRVLNFGPLD